VGAAEIFSDISAMKKLERIAGDLEDLAYFDELTRVANRRYTELKIQQAIEEVQEFHRAYGIILIDIDHFKKVNDRYGHQTGDEVLKRLCEVLGECLRPGDLIGRWGGDEFVVVAKDVMPDSLERLAERCRLLIRKTPMVVNQDGPIRLRVSLGATLLGAGDQCHSALDRADKLMYASKGAGKNRVHIG
jgi:diguanylate cyclase (GGDEF)-like protein